MASSLERFQIMMEEIGPSMPEIEAVIQSEESNWAIQFENQTITTLEWSEKPDRVVLSSAMGIPSKSMQLTVYETLLCYNLLWKETGGVKMGLAGPDGELMLLYEMYMDNLTLQDLQTILVNFINISSAWSVFITDEKGSLVAPNNENLDMLHLGA